VPVTSVDVNLSGPLFDGRADAALRGFVDDAEQAVAAQAYAEVMTFLDQSIQYPTPYYETLITVTKTAGGRVVHDRGVVYGPFLEDGTGSGRGPTPRHAPRNRRQRPRRGSGPFRGYRSFAKARAAIEAKAPRIVEHTLRKWLRQMGG
jgi:hypothetical protein